MREIKFSYVYQHDDTGRILIREFDIHEIELELMGECFIEGYTLIARRQYTGLKDKNGLTEIYEGDIVNIRGGAFYQGYWEINEIFEVIYDETGFLLKNKDYKENFWIAEEIEVIGNIYENKELLTHQNRR